jgi:uncharacterized protein (DUF58 family)
MKKWIRRQFRKKVRVYIFPTRMGGYFNGLIFLMFLLSVGYANNLLLIFTLFLLSFNLIWLVQTHFHLHALKFDSLSLKNGHVGETLPVCIRWRSSPQRPFQWAIDLEGNREVVTLSTLEEEAHQSVGEIILAQRGRQSWQYLKVETILPFGLYRSWIYFPLVETTFAYPALLKTTGLGHIGETHLEGQVPQERKGTEDIRELSPYRGEESRKISWKHFARSGDLYVKEGTEWNDRHLYLKIEPPSEAEAKENYLKVMATRMVEAYRQQVPFTFEIDGSVKRGPSAQEKYLHECLKDLGLC